jgi:uncharacterized protein YbjT (DUF2867 family)
MYLITGATGNVGAELVDLLARAGEPVRALARGHDPSAGKRDGVEYAVGDLNDAGTVRPAVAGVRGIFLVPGYDGLPRILSDARDAGAERVVLLSTSAAAGGDTSNAITSFMLGSEQAVRASGLAWTVLRAYGFMSNTLRWVPELASGDVVREPFAEVPVAMIDPLDIAAVAAVALREDGHAGQTYVLSGPAAVRPADRLGILGDLLHRELRLDALDRQAGYAMLAEQMPAPYVDAMVDYYAAGSLDESQPTGTVQRLLDRPPRTFAQWAAAHVDRFARPTP